MALMLMLITCMPDPAASKGGKKRYMRATYKFGDNIFISLPDDRLSMNEFIWTCMMSLRETEHNIAVLDSTMAEFPGYRPMMHLNKIRLYKQLATAFTEVEK